jgi:hypothetical protein
VSFLSQPVFAAGLRQPVFAAGSGEPALEVLELVMSSS